MKSNFDNIALPGIRCHAVIATMEWLAGLFLASMAVAFLTGDMTVERWLDPRVANMVK